MEIQNLDGYVGFGLIVHSFVYCPECTPSELVVNDVFVDLSIGDGLSWFEVLGIAEVEGVDFGGGNFFHFDYLILIINSYS